VPPPGAAGTSESFKVEGIDSGTSYYFAIKTRNIHGAWSPLSNVAVAATSSSTSGGNGIVDTSSDDDTAYSMGIMILGLLAVTAVLLRIVVTRRRQERLRGRWRALRKKE
jgi:hypothetical protein